MSLIKDKYTGCLLGLAVGDAVGTTLEFETRGTFTPITDMVGGGPFHLKPGEWTDDTSMALCLAHSLIEKGCFDPEDQASKYCDWYRKGYMSSNGDCFDIGNTVRDALIRFEQTGDPYSGSDDPLAAGNGGIMRLVPIPMFYGNSLDDVLTYSGLSSRVTHGALEAVEGAQLFGAQLYYALNDYNKDDIVFRAPFEPSVEKVKAIKEGLYTKKSVHDIEGSGYIIKSLEAAMWCFYHSESYEETVLKAANLGNDADTTAAIAGQLAGAFYGIKGIPPKWLEKLVMREEIESLGEQLFHRAMKEGRV